MSWTHAICSECWARDFPGRTPTKLIESGTERCCHCGELTTSGIYVRADPTTVAFPREETF